MTKIQRGYCSVRYNSNVPLAFIFLDQVVYCFYNSLAGFMHRFSTEGTQACTEPSQNDGCRVTILTEMVS